MTTKLKPWPADAVMVVAPSPAEAIINPNDPTGLDWCRDCGNEVVFRRSSVTTASVPDLARGRWVKFFCIQCAVGYDPKSMDVFLDLRPKAE